MTGGRPRSISAVSLRPFFSNSERRPVTIWSSRGESAKGWRLSAIRPTSMREKSSSALMVLESRSRLRCTTTRPFSCFSVMAPSLRSRM